MNNEKKHIIIYDIVSEDFMGMKTNIVMYHTLSPAYILGVCCNRHWREQLCTLRRHVLFYDDDFNPTEIFTTTSKDHEQHELLTHDEISDKQILFEYELLKQSVDFDDEYSSCGTFIERSHDEEFTLKTQYKKIYLDKMK